MPQFHLIFTEGSSRIRYRSCADQGIFVRGGGGGGSRSALQKSSDNVFFLVLSLFYRRQMKSIIFQGSRGGPTFSRGGGGVTFFKGWGGGSSCLFSIETHITCDFPVCVCVCVCVGGGSGPPVPPLWIRTCRSSSKRGITRNILTELWPFFDLNFG